MFISIYTKVDTMLKIILPLIIYNLILIAIRNLICLRHLIEGAFYLTGKTGIASIATVAVNGKHVSG